MNRLIFAFVMVAALAVPSFAQQLTLQIQDGRVTLDAVNVPARQILAEWARVGGTTVVGADKITGTPLTLKLTDVPEDRALDIILRNVAGYMAAPRQVSASPGSSTYDRILIMATSTVAPPPPGARANGNAPFGAPNGVRMPSRPPDLPPAVGDDVPAEEPVVPDDQADTGAAPVFTFPPPPPGSVAPGGNPVFVPVPNGQPGFATPGAMTAPVITLQPGPEGPTIYNFVPQNQPGTQPAPHTGFTVIGSPTPGMIQVPQPAQGQPAPPTRPPGQ